MVEWLPLKLPLLMVRALRLSKLVEGGGRVLIVVPSPVAVLASWSLSVATVVAFGVSSFHDENCVRFINYNRASKITYKSQSNSNSKDVF